MHIHLDLLQYRRAPGSAMRKAGTAIGSVAFSKLGAYALNHKRAYALISCNSLLAKKTGGGETEWLNSKNSAAVWASIAAIAGCCGRLHAGFRNSMTANWRPLAFAL